MAVSSGKFMLSGLEVFNTITLYIILFEETLIPCLMTDAKHRSRMSGDSDKRYQSSVSFV